MSSPVVNTAALRAIKARNPALFVDASGAMSPGELAIRVFTLGNRLADVTRLPAGSRRDQAIEASQLAFESLPQSVQAVANGLWLQEVRRVGWPRSWIGIANVLQGHMGEGFTTDRPQSAPAMQARHPLRALTMGLGEDAAEDIGEMINGEEDMGSPLTDLMSEVDEAIAEVEEEKRRREEGENKENEAPEWRATLVEIRTPTPVRTSRLLFGDRGESFAQAPMNPNDGLPVVPTVEPSHTPIRYLSPSSNLILDEVRKVAMHQSSLRMQQNQLDRGVAGHINHLGGSICRSFQTVERWADERCDLIREHVTETVRDQVAAAVEELQTSTAHTMSVQLDRFERMETEDLVKEVNDLHNVFGSIASDIKEKVKDHASRKFGKMRQMINDKFDWQEKVMRNDQDVSDSHSSL
jgi:hypothetical protein